MITFISNWAEQVTLAVIVATIIEMLLPNNKNKKYIKTIIGIYILFTIISPVIKNNNAFSVNDIDLSKYELEEKQVVNQESMDKRLEDLYIEELKKNVIEKVEESGYKVLSCKIDAVLKKDDKNAGINKISLKISKNKNINIEKVDININEKHEEKSTSIEIKDLKENLSKSYELDENKILIILKEN